MSVLDRTKQKIFPQDSEARDQAKERLEQLALPYWALGDLMDLAIELAGMTASTSPQVDNKAIVTMAAVVAIVTMVAVGAMVTMVTVAESSHNGKALNTRQ